MQTFPAVTETPAPAPLLGRVGMTFFGENVYGPLDAGFQEDQVRLCGLQHSLQELFMHVVCGLTPLVLPSIILANKHSAPNLPHNCAYVAGVSGRQL